MGSEGFLYLSIIENAQEIDTKEEATKYHCLSLCVYQVMKVVGGSMCDSGTAVVSSVFTTGQ